MKPMVEPVEAHPSRESTWALELPRGLKRPWLGLVPVAAVFLASMWQMRLDWAYDDAYHYGWTVPALMGYLISVRWRDRPAVDCVARRSVASWAALGVAFLVSWLVREANPDWRLIGVALGGLAIMAGLLWFRDAGGRAWQRHFAGAVGFFALGVPWPTIVEQAITGILMPVNAALTLEALHWLGVPAIRTGNLITLREGTLGVEEACSGIRSLQATLMMALFLGELHLLRLRDRGLLLALGGGLALATNAVRTTVLSVMAARAGMAEADRWHDGVGLTVLTIHGLALFAVTLAFTRRCPRNPKISQPRHLPLAWPARGPAVLAGALIITAPATHFWYARNELPQTADWSLTPPREAPKFEELTIPHRIRLILRHDAGWSGRWQTEEGHRLHAYYLEWNPGSVPPGSLAAHTPGHCLSHIGMTLESESSPPLVIQGPMGSMPVSCLRFNDRGEALFVAHAVQALNYTEPSLLKSDGRLTYRKRLRAAWRGQRNEGQRLIEIGLWGVSSEAEAREIFLGFFQNRIAFATRP